MVLVKFFRGSFDLPWKNLSVWHCLSQIPSKSSVFYSESFCTRLMTNQSLPCAQTAFSWSVQILRLPDKNWKNIPDKLWLFAPKNSTSLEKNCEILTTSIGQIFTLTAANIQYEIGGVVSASPAFSMYTGKTVYSHSKDDLVSQSL
jgi:hypothetical protein